MIDVGGGDSRLVDCLIERGYDCVTVLDVSGVALARAKTRVAAKGERVTWIQADIRGPWSSPPMNLWHDRAVFHFLTDAADRARYVNRLRDTLAAAGHVILATFALDGPDRCSGLPVVRYSAETLAAELGPTFELEQAFTVSHPTPGGATQPFCFAHFRRIT